jgi:hypothetical protein
MKAGRGKKSNRSLTQVARAGQQKGGDPVGRIEKPAIGKSAFRGDDCRPLRKLFGPGRKVD